MCGRFAIENELLDAYHEYLHDFVDALKNAKQESRYNIAPTSQCLIRKWAGSEPVISSARWGLVPSWSKDSKSSFSTFNARGETAHTKPTFRSAFKKRRCLVPATGYFEWKKTDEGKQPHLIHLPDKKPFFMLGLWECWFGPRDQPRTEPLESFTIITTQARSDLQSIHDRMPVIVDIESDVEAIWLDDEFQGVEELRSQLRPYEGDMTTTLVSKYVSNTRNQGPRCVESCE